MEFINWFPGHMAKSLREIKEKQNIVDCFIVLIDSRVPLSSYNEEFDAIAPNKPRLFIFSKMDYTNLNKLNKILPKFNNGLDQVVVVNLKKQSSKQKIIKSLEKALKQKKEKDLKKGLLKPRLRCFVVGMPNVGKSTLINLLANSKKTKVANFAGTTRSLQWVNIGDIQLLDTPGILLPKLSNQKNAIKLVATNLIKNDVISDSNFYYEMLDIINEKCPEKFKEIGIEYFVDEVDKYNELIKYSRKHNIIQKNGKINIDKALSILRTKIMNLKNVIWD